MDAHGLSDTFPPAALDQVAALSGPAPLAGPGVRDLRALHWISMDNPTTRDMDQLVHVEDLGDGRLRVRMAVADVAALVDKGSPVDRHCLTNTATVYTPLKDYGLLPERLCTDLTSLLPGQDRRAVVTEYVLDKAGRMESWQAYEAAVHNHEGLTYGAVNLALEGKREFSPATSEQVRLHMEAGRRLEAAAEQRGEIRFGSPRENPAGDALAHLSVAASTANALYLHGKGYALLQRASNPPGAWSKMRTLTSQAAARLQSPTLLSGALPERPDSAALARFLREYRQADPNGAPDVELGLIKLLGPSEYASCSPQSPLRSHFAQALPVASAPSTAPNRRLADLINQRQLKAAITGQPAPYSHADLKQLAPLLQRKESSVKAVQRQLQKAAAAADLADKIGQRFGAVVTGTRATGTYVRVINPRIEGRLTELEPSLQVGQRIKVELRSVSVEDGLLDFTRVRERPAPPPTTLLAT